MTHSMPEQVLRDVISRLGAVDDGYKAMGEHVHDCDQRSLRRRLELEQLRKDHEDHKVVVKEDNGKSKLSAMLLPALPGIVAAAIGWGVLSNTVDNLKDEQKDQMGEIRELRNKVSELRAGGK